MSTQKDKIERWKNAMIDSARKIYKEDKELMPVAMLYVEDSATIIVGMPFSNQREKELCSHKLRDLVRQHKAIACLFIHEGYMKQFKKKDKDILNAYQSGNLSVKDMDGRIEAVVIVFETKSGDKELITIEIENKKLGEEKSIKDGDAQGLFSNFFATPIWVN